MKETIEGKALCFGDNITTDYISPGKYRVQNITMKEYAKHMMEDIRPGFYNKITAGDFIVAGKNFGCGSSRETAPLVIKEAKISAVLAKSFARIFFRNSISIGLLLIECDTSLIREGDLLKVDIVKGIIETPDRIINIKPIPEILYNIISDNGTVAHFKKYGSFNLDKSTISDD